MTLKKTPPHKNPASALRENIKRPSIDTAYLDFIPHPVFQQEATKLAFTEAKIGSGMGSGERASHTPAASKYDLWAIQARLHGNLMRLDHRHREEWA